MSEEYRDVGETKRNPSEEKCLKASLKSGYD